MLFHELTKHTGNELVDEISASIPREADELLRKNDITSSSACCDQEDSCILHELDDILDEDETELIATSEDDLNNYLNDEAIATSGHEGLSFKLYSSTNLECNVVDNINLTHSKFVERSVSSKRTDIEDCVIDDRISHWLRHGQILFASHIQFPKQVNESVNTVNMQENAPTLKYLMQKYLPKWLIFQSFYDGLNILRSSCFESDNFAPHLRNFLPGNRNVVYHNPNRLHRVDINLGTGTHYYVVIEYPFSKMFQEWIVTFKLFDRTMIENNHTSSDVIVCYPPIDWLYEANIPFYSGIQQPGDIILLKHDCLYWEYTINGTSQHATWEIFPLFQDQLYTSIYAETAHFIHSPLPRIPIPWNQLPFQSIDHRQRRLPLHVFLYDLLMYCVQHLPLEYRRSILI